MKINVQKFVLWTDFIQNCPVTQQLFNEYDHQHITWGTNNRSMIDADTFESWMAGVSSFIPELEQALLFARFDEITSQDCLIDLEN